MAKVIESSAVAAADLTLCILQQHSRERSLMKRLLTGLNHMLVHGTTRLFSILGSVANAHFFTQTVQIWPKLKSGTLRCLLN